MDMTDETRWFNESRHPIAQGFRALAGMYNNVKDPLIRKNMKNFVCEARRQGLVKTTQRQNLIASAELWDE